MVAELTINIQTNIGTVKILLSLFFLSLTILFNIDYISDNIYVVEVPKYLIVSAILSV